MSDRERMGGGPPQEEEGRPKVKITDRRRVRPEAEARAAAGGRGADTRARSRPAEERHGEAGSPVPPEPAESQGSETEADVETVRRQAEEYRDHLQRLAADFDNYRKRVLKEQTRAVEMAAEPLVRRLLEVLDEFDLALMAAERNPDFQKFLHGVELVYAKLQDILRAEGVERIEAEGKAFDPELHEALMQAGDGEGEPYVADVLRQGYLLKGRVVRPAGVKVGRR